MGCREWIRHAELRQDDDGAMDSGSQPENMSMPEERASLAGDGEVVHVALPGLNWTLCNVCRSIGPASSKLPDSMPTTNIVFMRLCNFCHHYITESRFCGIYQ